MEAYDIYNLAIDLHLGVNTAMRCWRSTKFHTTHDRIFRSYNHRIVVLMRTDSDIIVAETSSQLYPTRRLEMVGLTLFVRLILVWKVSLLVF